MLYSAFSTAMSRGMDRPVCSFRFENLSVFIVSIASSTYTAWIIIRVHVLQRMATGSEQQEDSLYVGLLVWLDYLDLMDPFAQSQPLERPTPEWRVVYKRHCDFHFTGAGTLLAKLQNWHSKLLESSPRAWTACLHPHPTLNTEVKI